MAEVIVFWVLRFSAISGRGGKALRYSTDRLVRILKSLGATASF
jgi:hypothetical protein